MKKRSHIHLAIAYPTYLAHLLPAHTPPSLPRRTPLLFMREKPFPYSRQEFKLAKNYEVVGGKQMVAMRNRLKRMQKLTLRAGALPSVSDAHPKKSKTEVNCDWVSKEDVVGSLPRILRNKSEDILQPQQTSSPITTLLKQGKVERRLGEVNFEGHTSIKKLKKRLGKFKKQWKDYQNRTALSLHTNHHKTQSLAVSVSKQAEELIVCLGKEKFGKNWLSSLRSASLGKKQSISLPIVKIFRKQLNLAAHGRSKLQSQFEWLSRSESTGHLFKFPDCS